MADIKLVRIDFRLIHGQVITKWFGSCRANEILIVDDELAHDKFMAGIYEMSAPPGTRVIVRSVEDTICDWKNDKFGSSKLLVLFRGVEQTHKAFQLGFPFKEIQIGGLGSAPGRKVVFGPITMDDTDARMLKEIADTGVRIYLHQVPEERSAELAPILKKNGFDLNN